MEVGDEGGDGGSADGKKPLADSGEKPAKRKMKTAFQLELLEKTYAVASYPSEEMRAELSVKLGLTDRQLQMWFCHRRLKDRKASEMAAQVAAAPSGSGSGSSPHIVPRKALARMSPHGIPRMGAADMWVPKNRYYDATTSPQQTLLELRAIAFVESQLGEQIRTDGPVLGVEFDPLPPGAFGAPIETSRQQKQPALSYDAQMFETRDARHIKTSAFLPSSEHCFLSSSSAAKRKVAPPGAQMVKSQVPRALLEYQFLPEQPSVRAEPLERFRPSHLDDATVDASGNRISSLKNGGPLFCGNEKMITGYAYQDQVFASGISEPVRQPVISSGVVAYDNFPPSSSYMNAGSDAPFGTNHITGIENHMLSSERRIFHVEDVARLERKRKNEEARIAKEEKRNRKELEKQDILRQKREEQMRREMERLERERKKEEERLLRERQREEERFQREQKRENERREKFLIKEKRRVEKMRLKEEMRREKRAARIKAAMEKATARKLAREHMELIEDERLELMELAASSKGLPSLISLDSSALQNLDLFRDMLSEFPPNSVRLKRPFVVQPWAQSEENVANLLMVWRFLITFVDVLSLWPFTLDEFVQALHDHDPRLLGEIHVALLKIIIKDIEDVARTPATAAGFSQNSAANPGGGHPHIVEGAYEWGFNICTWQKHLSPLTWPEILRQVALSAGFGPELKRTVEKPYHRDENEGHDGRNIISNLRSGMAAESAAALMQEKGISYLGRSRHRLTPGTVKFAAFHVLSVEGSKGLTILEVADKIQKSGLRDLTKSKTPEASIGAALSRDTKLFERTAPSTYCVRPPFRKDPAGAEAIFASAREKIHMFQNGISFSDAEKDTEDAERDDDSESDGVEDPEAESSPEEIFANEFLRKDEMNTFKASDCLGDEKEDLLCDNIEINSKHLGGNLKEAFCHRTSEDSKIVSISDTINSGTIGVPSVCDSYISDLEAIEIDESNSGEPWVEGLMEGEYSNLSVEERLNALVSLIGVAIEGNSIRIVLEDRLEAATALKKQMWAEVQLDKRRIKEEHMIRSPFTSLMGMNAGMNAESFQVNPLLDENLPLAVGNKGMDVNLNFSVNDENMTMEKSNNVNSMAPERNLMGQQFLAYPDNVLPQPCGFTAEKSRSQLKSYISHKAEQIYVYRSLPLGQDRRRNRYWLFVTSASANDPGSGRIFFESREGFWRLIDSEEAFDALVAALDTRGLRESHLYSMLQKIEFSFKEAVRNKAKILDKEANEHNEGIENPGKNSSAFGFDTSQTSRSFRIELGYHQAEYHGALERYLDSQRWLWKECFNNTVLCAMKHGKRRCSELVKTCYLCCLSYFSEEKHCSSCHKTFKNYHNVDTSFSGHLAWCLGKRNGDYHETPCILESSLPMRLQLLKAQLSVVEASIPSEALQHFWTEGYRKSWGMKLQSATSVDALLEALTLLEGAVRSDHLSSTFETTNELLSCSAIPGSTLDSTLSHSGSVPVLPWIPYTTAAVALRLMDLDASIFYTMNQKAESHKERESGHFINTPARNAVLQNNPELEQFRTLDQSAFQPEEWSGSKIRNQLHGRGSRGGRGRGRGARGQRRGTTLTRARFTERKAWQSDWTVPKQKRRGRPPGRGRKRGRRTVRPRQKSEGRLSIGKGIDAGDFQDHNSVANSPLESPRSYAGEEWDVEGTRKAYVAEEDDDNYIGASGSDDNGQTSGDEYDNQLADYSQNYGAKSDNGSEDEADGVGDGNEEEDGDDVNEDFEDDENEDGEDIIGDEDVDEEEDIGRISDEDGDAMSFSSEYSD